jgi:hypothetical protein
MPVEVRFEQQGTGPDAKFVPVFAPVTGASRRKSTQNA